MNGITSLNKDLSDSRLFIIEGLLATKYQHKNEILFYIISK